MKPVDLTDVFAAITTHWDPHIAGELNGQQVKCAKLKGEFVWHKHDHEDELFLVHRGVLQMRLRAGVVTIRPGQFYIVPRGVEHQPVRAGGGRSGAVRTSIDAQHGQRPQRADERNIETRRRRIVPNQRSPVDGPGSPR